MYNDRETHQVYLDALAEVSKIGTIPAGYLNAKISIHNGANNDRNCLNSPVYKFVINEFNFNHASWHVVLHYIDGQKYLIMIIAVYIMKFCICAIMDLKCTHFFAGSGG